MGLVNDGMPFRTSEAARFGLSPKALRRAVAQGRVTRVCRGVCVDGSVVLDQPARAAALSLVLPPGVAATLGTAAWLYGIPPLEPGADRRPTPLELASTTTTTGPRRAGCRGATRAVPDDALVCVGGVLVTRAATTAVDLARDRDRPDALAYCDAFLRAALVNRSELLTEVDRWAGHRGVEQAREITALADGRAESPGESWTRLRYLDGGFPPIEPQHWVTDDNSLPVYRLDLWVVGMRKGVEYDGLDWHGPEQFAADFARRRWLERRGWDLLSVGQREVLGGDHTFERLVGELTGREPRLHTFDYRRRTRSGLPWPSRGAVTA